MRAYFISIRRCVSWLTDRRHCITDAPQATGLETSLRFKPFRDEYVKGEIKTLLGDGAITLARLEGHWDDEISVKSTAGDASGVVFSANDDPLQF